MTVAAPGIFKLVGGGADRAVRRTFFLGASRIHFSKKLESEGACQGGTFALSKVKLKDFVHTFGEFCEYFSKKCKFPKFLPPPPAAFGHGGKGGQGNFVHVFTIHFFLQFSKFLGGNWGDNAPD